jgi:hypothetical protein
MADPTKVLTEPTPVTVTVAASTLGTGPGTIITKAGEANIVVKVVQPLVIVLVRAMRVFLQTLLGLLTAGLVTPKALPAADFIHLLGLCAGLSLAPAVVCVIQNAIELLGKLDQSFPTLAG